MAESMVLNPDGCLDHGSSSSIVQRRIEFHPARKPFNGFRNGGGDFRLDTLNPGSDSRRTPPNQIQSVKGGKRPGGSEFLENGLDPELSLGISIRKIGAGLMNLGNTCFLNSVLQCLTHTEPLAAYLQSGKHQSSCRVAGFCALCAIQKHVSRALQSTGSILAPKDLVSNLRCISRNFRNARQEDAHEYMVNLLESMHKCCLPSGVPSESPGAYDKSLVHKIFGGRLRSQVKCMQCNYCSDTFDPFLDLSLEIAKADSLQKALANFTAAEQLDGGGRQYQCQKCKHKVKALKQLTVHKAPYVLTIHLKRFRAYNPGQKIDKKVHFSPTLDLKPFVSGSYEGDLKYTLYGVLVHYGFSTHSGHYYSFVRTSGGTWYNLDDNRVAAVGERTVLEQKAYMLFYVRDRRNNAPRKLVNTVQNENMKASNGGNKTVFTFKQGYSAPVQNSITENEAKGVASSVGSTKEAPLQNPNSSKIESVPGTASKVKVESSSKPYSHAVEKTAGTSNNDLSVSVNVFFSTSNPPNSIDKLSGEETLQKSDPVSEALFFNPVSSVKTVGKIDTVKSRDQPSHDSSPDGSVDNLGLSSMISRSSSKEALSCPPKREIKKKLWKFQVASMRLSPNILFGSLIRQKKFKRSKRRGLDSKSLGKEILSDLGPSTSEKTSKISLHATNVGKRPGKSSSKRAGFSAAATEGSHFFGDSVAEDGKLRDRTNQNGAEAASDKQTDKVSSSIVVGNQSDGIETMQNGIMSLLSRGLEETFVPSWDAIDVPSSHTAQSKSSETTSIGYIGDEWDEEYDMGRRKKVRTFKHAFDGPNLFQEIASKKTRSKEPRIDQSSSRNQPFRI